jgi:UDP-N-acetylmuramate dehydrogenase
MPTALQRAVDLQACNTLALPARCALFATVSQAEQLLALAEETRGTPRFILGGGSNLVLTGDFDGLVLHMAIAGRQLAGEDGEAWYVRAGAGENWHDFVQWTLAQGWPGLENLALIPGTVGAAPIQNIGAYGLEVAEVFHSLRAVDLDSGATKEFDRAACRFGYRDSVFKQEGWHLNGRYAITDVTFRLPKRWQPRTGYADVARELTAQEIVTPTAQDIAAAVIAVRQRKLPAPADIPNAGSFFKNPLISAAIAGELAAKYPTLAQYVQPDGSVKLAAGWLIEQAGWKGRNLGPAGMYEKQALILVNRGGATGRDVQALAAAVKQSVAERFGVTLEAEPIFL